MLLHLLTACTDAPDTATDADPTIAFLLPAAGATVSAGSVDFSVVVENFTLVDLAKHSEGETPEGYIALSVAGAEALQTGATAFSLLLDTAGVVEVTAELMYTDGDPLDEPASAVVALTVE